MPPTTSRKPSWSWAFEGATALRCTFHRLMEGATLLKCSEFADAIIEGMD